MRFSFLLLLVSLLHSLHAGVMDEAHRWTLRDTEDDTDFASGEPSQSASAWVKYTRGGEAPQTATVDEVEDFEQYLRTRPDIFTAGPNSRLESFVGEQMEDGPDKVDTVKRVNPRPTAERETSLPMASIVLDEVASTNFYPEYAIGLLENGCTAFLVGPRHAVTAAHCVYNTTSGVFIETLDMWRGRNRDAFLEHMVWTDVIIPLSYSISPSDGLDWALIVFNKPSTSTVWLKMGFSESIYNVPYTLFGYLSSKAYGVMYSTVCRSRAESSEEEQDRVLEVQCGSDECFDGGPLLRGYNFKRSKMPMAYGVSLSSCASYSFSHNNVVFLPELFWSLCYLMSENGFDARCDIKN
jgi:V8-like Glu-specific endopeptidase